MSSNCLLRKVIWRSPVDSVADLLGVARGSAELNVAQFGANAAAGRRDLNGRLGC